MINQFSRTQLLIGKKAIEKLHKAHVAVFGIGGVGGYIVEALARNGVGTFDLIDNDTVSLTNINRQIIALHSTIGKYKTEVMKERILDINPEANVNIHNCFFLPENSSSFDFTKYDYVVDAVDTVKAKMELIEKAKKAGTKIISCMGAGNKLDPSKFEITDISKTSVCPLARVIRNECKKRHITKLKVLFSTEKPVKPLTEEENIEQSSNPAKAIPGSTAFVPSVAGLMIAGEIIKDLIKE